MLDVEVQNILLFHYPKDGRFKRQILDKVLKNSVFLQCMYYENERFMKLKFLEIQEKNAMHLPYLEDGWFQGLKQWIAGAYSFIIIT